MAKVIIINSLLKEIEKRFKQEAHKVIDFLETLETNPNKGKLLISISGILIKELKYKSFRFYFIVDGYLIKVVDEASLSKLIIKFVAMSDKKHQQETINEIKQFLRTFGKNSLN